jgi:hypothetical protein
MEEEGGGVEVATLAVLAETDDVFEAADAEDEPDFDEVVAAEKAEVVAELLPEEAEVAVLEAEAEAEEVTEELMVN